MASSNSFTIKKIQYKKPSSTTIVLKCDCCSEDAVIEMTFSRFRRDKSEQNIGEKKKMYIEHKNKKYVRMCQGCYDRFKEFVNYF